MLNKEILTKIFKNLLDEAKKSYDDFNSADGKIGDGDLGVTILHGLEEVNNNLSKFSDDMGSNFMVCSQAFVKRSGSSFGTLIAFSFMNISKNLKGKKECNHMDIVNIFEISFCFSPIKTGIFNLIMPAFSLAISSNVLPTGNTQSIHPE